MAVPQERGRDLLCRRSPANHTHVPADTDHVAPELRLDVLRDELLTISCAKDNVEMVLGEGMCHLCRPLKGAHYSTICSPRPDGLGYRCDGPAALRCGQSAFSDHGDSGAPDKPDFGLLGRIPCDYGDRFSSASASASLPCLR